MEYKICKMKAPSATEYEMAQRCRSGAPELLQLLELLNSSVSLRLWI